MADYIAEVGRQTPVAARVDVIVSGGGPAGFGAALCAARQGARTVLLEQTGDIGGAATSGLMSHWTGNTKGGVYEEILQRSATPGCWRQAIDPEKLKTVLLEMLVEAGVQVHLYTFAVAPVLDAGRVGGVIAESKSGRTAFLAPVVIDASGDGDIAARAGVPYLQGREADGRMQPMTLMFKVAGVQCGLFPLPGSFESITPLADGTTLQQHAREVLPQPAGHVLLYETTLPGVVTVNMTNCIDVSGTSAEDLTRATLTCRQQMGTIVDFLQRFAPGFEECFAISSAAQIGVRETRHFQGDYSLTEEDILAARVFDDWVVTRAHFNFDIHNLDGSGLDENGVQNEFRQPRGYTIPYGCLLPVGVEGLLLAGRCISGTHKAHSNFRVMPICANIGQAAGIAAALAAQRGITPRELPVSDIQEALRAMGVEV